MKIGIIGCGAIGGGLAPFCGERLHALCDLDQEKVQALGLAKSLTADKLITECDLIIEAASQDVVLSLLRKVIDKEKSLMIMSVGGLLECSELLEEARQKSINIYVPTGAIAGIDALHAAKEAGISSVTLVFEGNAKEAIQKFPKNINVASLLSLVSGEQVRVKIVCDPDVKTNIHEITIVSKAGKITSTIENVPSENPKTSALAIYSAKATLKKIFDSVRFGT